MYTYFQAKRKLKTKKNYHPKEISVSKISLDMILNVLNEVLCVRTPLMVYAMLRTTYYEKPTGGLWTFVLPVAGS